MIFSELIKAGVAGVEYATWNPADKGANITLSGDLLTAHTTLDNVWTSNRATIGKSSGKCYWETIRLAAGSLRAEMGIAGASVPLNNAMGVDVNGWSIYGVFSINSRKFHNGVLASWGGWLFDQFDVIGHALDMDAGKYWTSENGVWTGDPEAGTGEMFSGVTGTVYPAIGHIDANCQMLANFGASDFSYPVPVGFDEGVYE